MQNYQWAAFDQNGNGTASRWPKSQKTGYSIKFKPAHQTFCCQQKPRCYCQNNLELSASSSATGWQRAVSPADRWSWAGGTPASSHEDWQSSLKLFWTYLPSGAQFTPDIHNTPAMCWWYLGSAAQQAGYILLWKHSYKRDLLIALSLSAYKMVEVRLFARETNISCLSEECSSCLLPGCHQAEINEIQRVNMQEKKQVCG